MQGFSEISDAARLPPQPKASVIVITYDHEDCLADAVDSIARQATNFPFEIVVAEDCSTDGTRAVAEALQRKYPHLVRLVFTPENKGMNRNLRFALARARAPYIAYCEGDDFWIDEGKLERQVAALDAAPTVDLAFTQGVRAYSDSRREIEEGWDYGPCPRIVTPKELFANFRWVAPTASLVWRAEVSRNLPDWFDDAPFGDLPLMIAASVRGGAAYDPAVAVGYRIAHRSSFTNRLRNASSGVRAEYIRNAMAALLRACAEYRFPPKHLAHRLTDYRLWLVKELLASRQWSAALREVVRIDPIFLLQGVGRRLRRLAGP